MQSEREGARKIIHENEDPNLRGLNPRVPITCPFIETDHSVMVAPESALAGTAPSWVPCLCFVVIRWRAEGKTPKQEEKSTNKAMLEGLRYLAPHLVFSRFRSPPLEDHVFIAFLPSFPHTAMTFLPPFFVYPRG